MARVKSPNYPQLSLPDALKALRAVFDKDGRNKLSRMTLAKHMGHDSLSGPALGKIGALRAYGLIEGTGDEVRITEAAVTAMMAPEGSPDRATTLNHLAVRPKLFQEIRKDFPDLPSPENLQFWLVKNKFSAEAAKVAAKSYLTTMRLAGGESPSYNAPMPEEQERIVNTQARETRLQATASRGAMPMGPVAGDGLRQEVITLDEGDVTITFPADLSADSFDDLKDHLDLFVKKMQRRAAKTASTDEAAN